MLGLEETGVEKGLWTERTCQAFLFISTEDEVWANKIPIQVFVCVFPESDMILTTLIQGNLTILFLLYKMLIRKNKPWGPFCPVILTLELPIAQECFHISFSQALLELKREEMKFCKQSSERRPLVPGKDSLWLYSWSGLNWQLHRLLWEPPSSLENWCCIKE